MPEPDRGDITPAQRQQLDRYLDEIERWNLRVNLTSVSRADAWDRHVEQSLTLLRTAAPPQGASLVDIGSGAGIPGLVMGLLRSDLSVTLLEADTRKAGFLIHVCGLLNLGNITVDGRRAETVASDAGRALFDLAVSRAAASPARLCRLAMPLLRQGGTLWALVADAGTAAGECTAVAAEVGAGPPVAAGPRVLSVPKL